ncbi:MAG: ATP-dependent zinc metalloprotease FtsH [Acidobacteriota bacterium]|nr:ATP-dependent zinc metalloprotease FtsH [Acidobacteriota bacterium]MDE3260716.1 ATP-dependent zinc metalloprotease FtsH [Acidobacteriota bacterium]
MSSTMKNLMFWLTASLVLILFWNVSSRISEEENELSFTQFMQRVEEDKVTDVRISGTGAGSEITGTDVEGKSFKTFAPEMEGLVSTLLDRGINVEADDASRTPWIVTLLSWLPILLIVGLFFFLIRQMQAPGNRAMSFGRSRAKLTSNQQKKVTFKDVAGVDEPKEELQEIIDFLKEPQKFQRLGGRIPKGVLLMGPPGTGKTLLARAISGEANVPFFTISGSDFVEMFVGVGASRVRDLFEQGKKNAPCIIFIDEIDAVGRQRGAGLGGGHDEREQTLNQLLVEMDGFESNDGVILIASTNRPDVLDPALLRPGRFDRRVVVSLPDIKGREGVLKVHSARIPFEADVDLSIIARGTPGFSGADLANLVNEAALNAARHTQKKVRMEDFEQAKDKVLMGAERRSVIMTPDEKRTTAYHEAGHALVAALLDKADPLHKVSIIPRGMAMGVTMLLPEDDRRTHDRDYVEAMIAVKMGGRLAEEIVLGQVTTGASDDIQKATDLARRMVCEWGMSETLGPLSFDRSNNEVFLGRDLAARKDYSESTAKAIDAEVHRIVDDAYHRAKKLLEENRDHLAAVAEALLEREVLSSEEVQLVLEGKPLPEPAPAPVAPDESADAAPEQVPGRVAITPPLVPEPGGAT